MNRKNLYIVIIGLSLAGYVWVGYNVLISTDNHSTTTLCIFKTITHLPCPSCGTTRSVVLLVNGHIWESLWLNPFGAMLALALLIIPFWVVVDILRKSDSYFRLYLSAERLLTQRKWISVPTIGVVLLNWTWNIFKGI
jgi:hypothetical protein